MRTLLRWDVIACAAAAVMAASATALSLLCSWCLPSAWCVHVRRLCFTKQQPSSLEFQPASNAAYVPALWQLSRIRRTSCAPGVLSHLDKEISIMSSLECCIKQFFVPLLVLSVLQLSSCPSNLPLSFVTQNLQTMLLLHA